MRQNNFRHGKGLDYYIEAVEQDDAQGGARRLIEIEQQEIRRKRARKANEGLRGLAISGGGIRSASFALGVLQALAAKDKLKQFDYLSTVSGGGYIGSSLTWFLHRLWPTLTGSAGQSERSISETLRFGSNAEDFPFALEDGDQQKNRIRRSIMRHLRQNAAYLTPGDGITTASLSAVMARGMVVSFLVYFPMLVVLFYSLLSLGFLQLVEAVPPYANALITGAGWLISLFVLSSVVYAMVTRLFTRNRPRMYRARRSYEAWAGLGLKVIAALLVIGAVPWVADKLIPGGQLGVSGSISLMAGIGAGLAAFKKNSGWRFLKKLPSGILFWLSSILLVFGLLLLAYAAANQVILQFDATSSSWPVLAMWGVAITMWLVGWLTNINFVSIHRYYRDRLMETFMPAFPDVLKPGSGPADTADQAALHKMWPDPAFTEEASTVALGPYPIINCNLILTDSKVKKYRARGGDSFILSPLYCGSSATGGWRRTDRYMDGDLSLSTAMAISGAAVSPNAGVGGKGPTRDIGTAFLMTLLNLRLGYWLPNPVSLPDTEDRVVCRNVKKFWKIVGLAPSGQGETKSLWKRLGVRPNLINPGLKALFGLGLSEKHRYVHLSDGGHFENLALYELIRRGLKLIICTDGGADPETGFSDLANMVERVRADFGVRIRGLELDGDGRLPAPETNGGRVGWKTRTLDLGPLVPGRRDAHGNRCANSGHLFLGICYADDTDEWASGLLLYIKSTWLDGMPADVVGYKRAHPSFPDQSTADQFFDEQQFEAYRTFGLEVGRRAFAQDTIPWSAQAEEPHSSYSGPRSHTL